MQKIALLLLYFMLFGFWSCNKLSPNSETSSMELTRISLRSTAISNCNAELFDRMQFLTLPEVEGENALSPLSKVARDSSIQFSQARVMVLNALSAYQAFNMIGPADWACKLAESNRECFFGRDLPDWVTLLASMQNFVQLDLVYTGTLTKVGNDVEGDIMVKPGPNFVIICFFDSQDRIVWTTSAQYLHLSKVVQGLGNGKVYEGLMDGWMINKANSQIWESADFGLKRDVSSVQAYAPYSYYFIPLIGKLGYSQDYASYACNRERARQDSLSHITPLPTDTTTGNLQGWTRAGNGNASQVATQDMDLTLLNGVPFVALEVADSNYRAAVRTQDGNGAWKYFANGCASAGTASHVALANNGTDLFLAYADKAFNNRITVNRGILASGRWTTVGSINVSAGAAGALDMAVHPVKGTPVVAFVDSSASAMIRVVCFDTTWKTLFLVGTAYSMQPKIMYRDTVLTLAFMDSAQQLSVFEYRNSWRTLGVSPVDEGMISYDMAGNSLDLCVVYQEALSRGGKLSAKSWDGQEFWNYKGVSGFTGSQGSDPSLVVKPGTRTFLTVFSDTLFTGKASLFSSPNSGFTQLTGGFSHYAVCKPILQIDTASGRLYCAVIEKNHNSLISVYYRLVP